MYCVHKLLSCERFLTQTPIFFLLDTFHPYSLFVHHDFGIPKQKAEEQHLFYSWKNDSFMSDAITVIDSAA